MRGSLLSGACTDGLSCSSCLRPGLGQGRAWFSLITASKASHVGSELGTAWSVLRQWCGVWLRGADGSLQAPGVVSVRMSTEEQAPWAFSPSTDEHRSSGALRPQTFCSLWQNHTLLTNLHQILAFDLGTSQEQTQGVFSKVTHAAAEIKISRARTCLPCSLDSE